MKTNIGKCNVVDKQLRKTNGGKIEIYLNIIEFMKRT